MRNPTLELAERATRLLLEQIERGVAREPVRMIIPSRLVRRASA